MSLSGGAPDLSTISIHALRVEGDRRSRAPDCDYDNHFYPRPPGGGRPSLQKKERLITDISIHALRVEGDAPFRGRPRTRY